jgi:hypothetical protein
VIIVVIVPFYSDYSDLDTLSVIRHDMKRFLFPAMPAAPIGAVEGRFSREFYPPIAGDDETRNAAKADRPTRKPGNGLGFG